MANPKKLEMSFSSAAVRANIIIFHETVRALMRAGSSPNEILAALMVEVACAASAMEIPEGELTLLQRIACLVVEE